jgi:hypothetical protein
VKVILWLREWRRRRTWFRVGAWLEELRQEALRAPDDQSLATAIGRANKIFVELESIGAVTRDERVSMMRDWVKAYARDRLPDLYREKRPAEILLLGSFLKVG